MKRLGIRAFSGYIECIQEIPLAISLIGGDQSNQVTLRMRGMTTGSSEVSATTGVSPVQTRQAIKEPAAVVSDSMTRLSARNASPQPQNTERLGQQSEVVGPQTQPQSSSNPGVLAKQVAQMITSDAEVAVLAQAHQLPSASMPISLSR